MKLQMDQVRDQEEIASFGGALLMKEWSGRFKIVGGTRDERRRAEEWTGQFLTKEVLCEH